MNCESETKKIFSPQDAAHNQYVNNQLSNMDNHC
jgi:hypothetical protein